MNRQTFFQAFGAIADAPGGIDRLRSLVLDLAVRGRLADQDRRDEPAAMLLTRMEADRERMVPAVQLRKPKRSPSVDKGTWPYNLPPGWKWAPFGSVVSSFDALRKPISRVHRTDGDYPYVGASGQIGTIDDFIFEGTYLMVGEDGGDFFGVAKRLAFLMRGKFWANNHVHVVSALPGADPKWLAVAINATSLDGAITGIAVPKLPWRTLGVLPIPIPPTSEQRRIVERVDVLMGLCDKLEHQQAARTEARAALTASTLNRVSAADTTENLRAAVRAFGDNIAVHLAPGEGDLAALNRLRQTILDLAVRGRLSHQDSTDEPATALIDRITSERARYFRSASTRKSSLKLAIAPDPQGRELPAGWIWSTVGQLTLSSDSGWSPACLPTVRTDDSQWGVLKVSAVTWGSFRSQEHKLLGPSLEPRPSIEVRDGDFLMSRANTSELVGRSVVVREPPPRLMLSDKLVRLKFADQVTAEYVNLVNASSATRAYYAIVSSGTSASMRNITRGQILSLAVPLPPLAEQARIVRRVAELSALCDNLETQFAASRVLRGDVAASVAAHAVSGPSTPYESADVPPVASVGTLRH